MLRMFGLGEGPEVEGAFGWGESVAKGESAAIDVRGHSCYAGFPTKSSFCVQRGDVLMPYLRAFSSFRDNVRSLAMTQAPPKQILEFCDKFRDVDLVPLGVALDDQEGENILSTFQEESRLCNDQQTDEHSSSLFLRLH
jgi:cysteinyl-tRNA synthetase